MNPKETARVALGGIAVTALGIVLGWAITSAPTARAEAPTETPPAERAEAPAPPEEKPAGEETTPKELTPAEIRELPILKRFEIPADVPIEKIDTILGDVKDETFGYGESAFYWLVDKVANMPVEAFKPSGDALPYSALLSLPSGYRGQPVTIRGVYMTVTPFRTPILALRRNVPVLYECIIREHPIEQQRPIATVVVIDDPMTYLKAEDHVVVKGYFYKVRAYKGTMGESICPMLVARRLEPEEGHRGTLSLAYLMGALVLVMGVAFLWIRQRTKAKANAADPRPVHRFRLHRPDRFEPPAVTGPGGEGGQPKP